jgi:hypothetical protein
LPGIITEDETTKEYGLVHAWSEMKAIEYLTDLSYHARELALP